MTARATGPGGTGDLLALIDSDAERASYALRVAELEAQLVEAARLLLDPAPPAFRVRAVLTAAGVDPETGTPGERRDAGIARAAARWTGDELNAVDEAIATVARRGHPFTTDDVWNTLPVGFPVTKGIAGRLIAAANAGTIANSGTTVTSIRKGPHGHAQRLTVWIPA